MDRYLMINADDFGNFQCSNAAIMELLTDEKSALTSSTIMAPCAWAAHACRFAAKNPELAAIDAIGLFEGGLAELCHVTVAVTAPVEDRVRRLMVRDGISEEYARNRIAAQHDEVWFREKCGHVLENDGTLQSFQAKCVAFLQTLGIMEP